MDKERHLREWPIKIKSEECYIEYFTKRIPLLLITTYDTFKIINTEELLLKYY